MQEIITAEIAGDFRTWTVRVSQTGADYTAAELGFPEGTVLPAVVDAEPELVVEYGDRSASAKTSPLFPSSVRVSFLDPDSALYDALAKVEAERGAGSLRLQLDAPAALGPRAADWFADPATGEPGEDGPYAWEGYAQLDTSEAPLFPGIDGAPLRISAGCGIARARELDAITTTDASAVPTVYEILRRGLGDDEEGSASPLRWLAPLRPQQALSDPLTLAALRFRPLVAYDESGVAVGVFTDAFRDEKGAPIKRREQLAELATLFAARLFRSLSAELEGGEYASGAVRSAWHLAPRAIAGETIDPEGETHAISGYGPYAIAGAPIPPGVAEPYGSPAFPLTARDFRGEGGRRSLRPSPVRLQRKPRQSEPGITSNPYFEGWINALPPGWQSSGTTPVRVTGIETPHAAQLASDTELFVSSARIEAGRPVLGYVRALCRAGVSGITRPLLARLRLYGDGGAVYALEMVLDGSGATAVSSRWVALADVVNEVEFYVDVTSGDITDTRGAECRTTATTFAKPSGDRLAPPLPVSGRVELRLRPSAASPPLVDSAELVFTGDLGLTVPDGASRPAEVETGLVDRGELEIEALAPVLGWTSVTIWSRGYELAGTASLDLLLVRTLYDALTSSALAGPVLVGTVEGLLLPERGAAIDLDTIPGLGSGVVRYAVEGSARYDLLAETSEVQLIPAGDSIPGAFDPATLTVAAPTDLVVTGSGAEAGAGYVDLAWDAVAGADGYRVYRSEASGGPYTLVEDLTLAEIDAYGDSATPTHRAEALTLGTEYFFVVTAYQDVP